MKFETILKYLVDEIKQDLDDVQTIANHPKVPLGNWYRNIRECIGSINDKLDMICE